ncbi:protein-export chaperone SecB [Maritimibacter sp. 55A14]|uniref:protein-export chaperone SecB n=1 Tax=Maritimibacter sp. 55A14 TaxID=2174844 RepID=UPI000D616CBF|nr:protein-export chaperone SecB [Maritimibacter sp. 55A14]PWE33562.1 protein-export chaperone SecB [Maritimibacter sp. 55A14]
MAETTESGNGAAQENQPPRMQILGQFIRDMSFENVAAQSGMKGDAQPDINVQVGVDARKRETENQYDVIVKLNISSKAKGGDTQIFLMELEYGGIIHLENVPADQLHPYLMIECPRMLFPFIRRIVSDVTRDGGYPPLNLDNIDFLQMYRQQLAQHQKAQAEGQNKAAN